MSEFERFAKENGITMQIVSRPIVSYYNPYAHLPSMAQHLTTAQENDLIAELKAKPAHMDRWRVAFKLGGKTIHETDYSKGIGLRENRKGERMPCFPLSRGLTIYDLEKLTGYKPIDPELGAVLSCLTEDMRSADQSFELWASEYGYDTDSRSAEKTYRACCETYSAFSLALGPAKLRALMEIDPE